MSADDLIMFLTPTETNPTPLAENARIIRAPRAPRTSEPADLVFGGDTYYEDFSGALRDLKFNALVLDTSVFGNGMPGTPGTPGAPDTPGTHKKGGKAGKKGGKPKQSRPARDLPEASFDEPIPRGEFDADIGPLLEPSGFSMGSHEARVTPHDISGFLTEDN